MSGDAQQANAEQNQSQSTSTAASTTYNPLANTSHEPAQASSAVGNSVVRDLMRVYESLTQSSTPQVSAEREGESKSSSAATTAAPSTYDPHQPPTQHYPHHPGQTQQVQQHPTSYSIPPPAYQIPHQSYPPQQNTPQQQSSYYGEHAYAHQQPPPPYAAPAGTEHPAHGFTVAAGHEQNAPDRPPEADEEEEDNESEGPEQITSSRSRRKRRGSDNSGAGSRGGGAKGRKKGKASDGRWSKRFTWPEDLHRDFVSAIFDVGLKHSSPSTILEHMPKHEQITTERIKSHLQKYRLHRIKSKKEFISSYESSLRNFQSRGLSGIKSISGGEVAAHLSYTTLDDTSGKGGTSGTPAPAPAPAKTTEITSSPAPTPKDSSSQTAQAAHESLMLPQLTDAEKQSPIGSAMGYLMGLFFSLKQQLMLQRAMEAAGDDPTKGSTPVQAVFNSFIAGGTPSAVPPAPASSDSVVDATQKQVQQVPPSSSQPQGPYEGGHGVVKSTTPVLSAPSARTNIEENSMMKREMQNQMALQNKMRAMKQQELNKYKNVQPSQAEEGKDRTAAVVAAAAAVAGASGAQPQIAAGENHESTLPSGAKATDNEANSRVYQGAGETAAGNDGAPGTAVRQRQRGLSIGASDEFWNTDVVDEQLFQFLMDN